MFGAAKTGRGAGVSYGARLVLGRAASGGVRITKDTGAFAARRPR